MFKHPACYLNSNLDQELVQPNAIDVTCDLLFKTTSGGISCQEVVFHKNQINHSNKIRDYTYTEYGMSAVRNSVMSDYWEIDARARNQVRYFESDLTIEVPEKMVGWLITRSSLNRNGVIVMSGLYDSGFKGCIAGTLYFNDEALYYLERGTRIAQFVMAEADMLHKYNGQYQGK